MRGILFHGAGHPVPHTLSLGTRSDNHLILFVGSSSVLCRLLPGSYIISGWIGYSGIACRLAPGTQIDPVGC